MRLVAKLFILLNDLLLFVAAVVFPVLVVVVFIKNPNVIGADTTFELLILWLIIYELVVIISFGILAIFVENYRNLQKIADAVSIDKDGDIGTTSGIPMPPTSPTIERREPSIKPLKKL